MAWGVPSCSKQQARSGGKCTKSAITGEALACPEGAGAAVVIAIDPVWSNCRHITAAAEVVKATNSEKPRTALITVRTVTLNTPPAGLEIGTPPSFRSAPTPSP
jgi:hypothetical protein